MILQEIRYGGLGNVMHTICFCHHVAKLNNISYDNIVFCRDMFKMEHGGTFEKYEDNIFANVKDKFVDEATWRSFEHVEHLNNCNCQNKILHLQKGKNYMFTTSLWCPNGWIGHVVESYQKFNGWDILYNKKVDDESMANIARKINADYRNAIAIHIRRGDFLTHDEWSRNAVRSLNDIQKIVSVENHQFLVFSDDTQWCKDNLTFRNCKVVDDNLSDWESMILMGHCKDVIPNKSSTFGAFAKLLNNYLKRGNK